MRGTSGPILAGCAVFPPDNAWNTDISGYPVHPNSDNFIANINGWGNDTLHADFGSYIYYGIPYTIVASTQPSLPITFDPQGYPGESDPGPYPIPPDAPIEGGPDSTGDRHVLVLEKDNCILYELYNATFIGSAWQVWSSAKFDLKSNALRPDGWTSAGAPGLPLPPRLRALDV